MDENQFNRIAVDLPNFPEPGIRMWLDHAIGDGWPPKHDKFGEPMGRWWNVLAHRPLGFWRAVTWTTEHIPLDLTSMDYESELIIKKMANAYAAGLDFDPDIPIQDSSARIGGFVKIIGDTGRMPVPPIFLRLPSGKLEALDGLHRLAALHYVRATGGVKHATHGVFVAQHSDPAAYETW